MIGRRGRKRARSLTTSLPFIGDRQPRLPRCGPLHPLPFLSALMPTDGYLSAHAARQHAYTD